MENDTLETLINRRDRWVGRLQEATNVYNIILESTTKYATLVAELEDQIIAFKTSQKEI